MARWEYKDYQWLEPQHFIWMKGLDAEKYVSGVKKTDIVYFKVEYSTQLIREIIPSATLLANFVGVAANALAISTPNNLDLILKPNVTNHLYQLTIGMEGIGRFFVNIEGHYIWTTDQLAVVQAAAPWVGYHTSLTSPKEEPSPASQFFLVYDIPFTLAYVHFDAAAAVPPTPTFKVDGRRLLLSHISKSEYPELYERLVRKQLPSRGVFCKEYATF